MGRYGLSKMSATMVSQRQKNLKLHWIKDPKTVQKDQI